MRIHAPGDLMDLGVMGLAPNHRERLRRAGINDVQALARANPEFLATQAGLPAGVIRSYTQRAAGHALLEDVKAFGPATFPALLEAGRRAIEGRVKAALRAQPRPKAIRSVSRRTPVRRGTSAPKVSLRDADAAPPAIVLKDPADLALQAPA